MGPLAFGRTAKTQQGASALTTPIVVNITVNAGETGFFWFCLAGATLGSGTGITGGGDWTLLLTLSNTNAKLELWATKAGQARAATSLSMAYTVNGSTAAEATVWAGPDIDGFGATATNTGTAANPSISLITTGRNRWVVAGFSMGDGVTATPTPTAGTGNLRSADSISAAGTFDGASAVTDNTIAFPGSVTNSITYPNTTGRWAAGAIEIISNAYGKKIPPSQRAA